MGHQASIEIDHITRTLEETGWRIEGPKGAAVILDINPSTLRTRMRKLGIKKPYGFRRSKVPSFAFQATEGMQGSAQLPAKKRPV